MNASAKYLMLHDAAAKAGCSDATFIHFGAEGDIPVYVLVDDWLVGQWPPGEKGKTDPVAVRNISEELARIDPSALSRIAEDAAAIISIVWVAKAIDGDGRDEVIPVSPIKRLNSKKGTPAAFAPVEICANECKFVVLEKDIDALITEQAARQHNGSSKYFTIKQAAQKISTSLPIADEKKRREAEKRYRKLLSDELLDGNLVGVDPENYYPIDKNKPGSVLGLQRALIHYGDLSNWASGKRLQINFEVAAAPLADKTDLVKETKKDRTPTEFINVFSTLIKEIKARALTKGKSFDCNNMPGIKKDLWEVAKSIDPVFRNLALRTFSDYQKQSGLCKFKRGSRSGDFYAKLFAD